MIEMADDLYENHVLGNVPETVISLCPSITETLFDLGMGHKVVGITDYCVYPTNELKQLKRVGGPKTLSIGDIEVLKPEIILASKEENSKEQIERLRKDFEVFVFDIETFDQALEMISKLGYIFKVAENAKQTVEGIIRGFESISAVGKGLQFLYFVWQKPWMAAGQRTYINSLLNKLGFVNALSSIETRYPIIDLDRNKADIVFLPSEPYKFSEQDKKLIESMDIAKNVLLVDGEMFCWYGSHMLKAINYFKVLFL